MREFGSNGGLGKEQSSSQGEQNIMRASHYENSTKDLQISSKHEPGHKHQTDATFESVEATRDLANTKETEVFNKTDKGTEPREVLDPKSKPIIAIRAPHGPKDLDNLTLMDEAIRSQIVASQVSAPDKKVAVFLEDAAGTKEYSDTFRSLVADTENPMLPTDAYIHDLEKKIFPDGVPDRIPKEGLRKELLANTDTYSREQYALLDEIAKEYPGKLDVVHENHGQEIVNQVRQDDYWQSFRLLNTNKDATVENLSADTVKDITTAVNKIAEVDSARDNDNVSKLASLVAENDIFAVIQVEGSVHTTGERLQNEGYNIIQHTIEEGKYNPLMKLVRDATITETPKRSEDIKNFLQD